MDQNLILSETELRRLAAELLSASGSSQEDAEQVAAVLVWADLRGRHPQGVFRIPVLAEMLKHGLISSPASLVWNERTPAIAHLDAGNGFGQIAGSLAMANAIQKAKAMGIGMVSVSGSNHFGAASYFCSLAAEAGCLGMTFTNATPKVAPYGGTKPIFGTNPIAFGCPTSSGDPILVDFASASIAGSTIRSMKERGEVLPDGVALDANGRPTNDLSALSSGSLLPAAGPKGYGLALLVEILCGILAGAGMSHEVGPFYSTWQRDVNSGHCFMAIDIVKHQSMSYFLERMDDLTAEIKSSPRRPGFEEILLPGEVRARYAEEYSRNGIPLSAETADALDKLAQTVNVEIPWKRSLHMTKAH